MNQEPPGGYTTPSFTIMGVKIQQCFLSYLFLSCLQRGTQKCDLLQLTHILSCRH